ncbi:MAG: N-6 DNA methylase [Pyrinomonadaceae bacterium]
MAQAADKVLGKKAQEKIDDVLHNEYVAEAMKRGIIEVKDNKVTYNLHQKKTYQWSDPEEWVRCRSIAFLIIKKGYPANRIKTEVTVPRRTPNDWADIVVYLDDRCREPFLVVENKPENTSKKDREQGIEQLFGNVNSLRSPFGLYDDYSTSTFYDVANFPPTERKDNIRGQRDAIPTQYGDVPVYQFLAGTENDIKSVRPSILESKIRRAHSIIWAGGKRDPLTAFDEWSKLLFAKVSDERSIPTGQPRDFQVGTKETTATVANRIHKRFAQACKSDTTIFPHGIRINLNDKKMYEVVRVLQDVSFVRTDVDSIGSAFENFFGSVFRGELGQYFTMRPLARFTVAMLDITHEDHLIDPTAGSGGFLLEALLQVWHSIDSNFKGQIASEIDRIKLDFALHGVYGIEIHEILARICKINLLLHHDGHTNVEGDKSCLDAVFARPRLNPPKEKFSRVVGNPPFGDEVQEGDDDHLGSNTLSTFEIATDRDKVASEQAILERCVDLLEGGGRLGLILPDGIFNNQGEQSNCPRVRRFLVKNGVIEAIVSLPDYAFRKSGAQNKTSILFFRKFTAAEKYHFDSVYESLISDDESESDALTRTLEGINYKVFLAEANHLGYTTTGVPSEKNDLYIGDTGGRLFDSQEGTILGEYQQFLKEPDSYNGRLSPDCMSISIVEMWNAHSSNRLDPKYFLFKREERTSIPAGWVKVEIGKAMQRRGSIIHPENEPDKPVKVMTIAQTGDIRPRQAGKGNNPPEWLGMYFEDSSSTWYAAESEDVVFSSIDLWKGCISVVPEEFNGALVTKEFPIYEITDERLDPNFLSCLLRTRYYQRAFRAITTGHSNRRRTQVADFEALEICFPPDKETQRQLVKDVMAAKYGQREAQNTLRQSMAAFSDLIDGRGDEELPDIEETEVGNEG